MNTNRSAEDVIRALREKNLKTDQATISASVQGGYTALPYKWLGEELRYRLSAGKICRRIVSLSSPACAKGIIWRRKESMRKPSPCLGKRIASSRITPLSFLACAWQRVSPVAKAAQMSAFGKPAHRITPIVVPVLAAGHAMKALIKINAWSVYLPSALSEPTGITLAQNIASGSVKAFSPLFAEAFTGSLLTSILIAAFLFAGKRIREKLDASLRHAAFMGIGVLTCLYASVVFNVLMK